MAMPSRSAAGTIRPTTTTGTLGAADGTEAFGEQGPRPASDHDAQRHADRQRRRSASWPATPRPAEPHGDRTRGSSGWPGPAGGDGRRWRGRRRGSRRERRQDPADHDGRAPAPPKFTNGSGSLMSWTETSVPRSQPGSAASAHRCSSSPSRSRRSSPSSTPSAPDQEADVGLLVRSSRWEAASDQRAFAEPVGFVQRGSTACPTTHVRRSDPGTWTSTLSPISAPAALMRRAPSTSASPRLAALEDRRRHRRRRCRAARRKPCSPSTSIWSPNAPTTATPRRRLLGVPQRPCSRDWVRTRSSSTVSHVTP